MQVVKHKSDNTLIWAPAYYHGSVLKSGEVWWARNVQGVESFRYVGLFNLAATREFARSKGFAIEIRLRGGRG